MMVSAGRVNTGEGGQSENRVTSREAAQVLYTISSWLSLVVALGLELVRLKSVSTF